MITDNKVILHIKLIYVNKSDIITVLIWLSIVLKYAFLTPPVANKVYGLSNGGPNIFKSS